MKSNLDPFSEFSDAQLWTALEQAHLAPLVRMDALGLECVIEANGANLSVGQRQLVCLARSVLRQTKILVLDEATASVDVQTDALIQSTIRTAFDKCSMLTIAHRLQTIIDSNQILVMDAGVALESGTPAQLLSSKSSAFYSMVMETGPSMAQSLMEAAQRGQTVEDSPGGSTPESSRRISRQLSRQLLNRSFSNPSTPESFPSDTARKTQMINNIRDLLEKAEVAAEDLRAETEPVPADAIHDLHQVQERLARLLHQIEEKQILAQVPFVETQ